jgi:hypothetical protein
MTNDSDPIMFCQRQNRVTMRNKVVTFNSQGTKLDRDNKVVVNVVPIRKPSAPSRNKPCPCGQGKKFKNCCRGAFEQQLQAYFEKTSVLPEGFNEVSD